MYLLAKRFHTYNPRGPVRVSMGFVEALSTANPMETSPQTIAKHNITIVATHRPKLNNPLSALSATERSKKEELKKY